MKSILTKYVNNCIICGCPTEEPHHLIFGSLRSIADKDNVVAPMCRICHEELHRNAQASELSKICGQLAWEKHYMATKGVGEDEARAAFRVRFTRSYL